MKILYIECNMGAAGDMLTAALFELLSEDEQTQVLRQLNNLGLPGVTVQAERSSKCGITGTYMKVTVDGEEEHSLDVHAAASLVSDKDTAPSDAHTTDGRSPHDNAVSHHHHHHTSMDDIRAIVSRMPLKENIRSDILHVYGRIADAEAHAHDMPVEQIHFHEVGTMDAITDVAAVCMLIDRICPDRIIASPVRTGYGEVRCAHGILPVPAPATSYLLRGVPSYSGDIEGEMCTPTGAALLGYFATSFGQRPAASWEKTGYGMGSKDFPAANCVRTFLGVTESVADGSGTGSGSANGVSCLKSDGAADGHAPGSDRSDSQTDQILELRCNLDDMTGEQIGFAMQALFDAGAKDVFTTPVGMKKNRPGVLLTVLCTPEMEEEMIRALFANTTTIGVRETVCSRRILKRENRKKATPYGDVTVKVSSGYGVGREKAEYDDVEEIAKNTGKALLEIQKDIGTC